MGFRPVEDMLHRQLNPGNLFRNGRSRDIIVALFYLGNVSISPVQHLLHLRGKCRGLCRLPGPKGCFLFLSFFQQEPVLLKIPICLVAGDQHGFFLVQMSLPEQPGSDHFLNFLANKFFRLTHGPRQLFQGTVGLVSQCLPIGLKPAHPV